MSAWSVMPWSHFGSQHKKTSEGGNDDCQRMNMLAGPRCSSSGQHKEYLFRCPLWHSHCFLCSHLPLMYAGQGPQLTCLSQALQVKVSYLELRMGFLQLVTVPIVPYCLLLPVMSPHCSWSTMCTWVVFTLAGFTHGPPPLGVSPLSTQEQGLELSCTELYPPGLEPCLACRNCSI